MKKGGDASAYAAGTCYEVFQITVCHLLCMVY